MSILIDILFISYLIGLVLFGLIIFQRIKPKGFSENIIFIIASVIWPVICLGVIVLASLSAMRRLKNTNETK